MITVTITEDTTKKLDIRLSLDDDELYNESTSTYYSDSTSDLLFMLIGMENKGELSNMIEIKLSEYSK